MDNRLNEVKVMQKLTQKLEVAVIDWNLIEASREEFRRNLAEGNDLPVELGQQLFEAYVNLKVERRLLQERVNLLVDEIERLRVERDRLERARYYPGNGDMGG